MDLCCIRDCIILRFSFLFSLLCCGLSTESGLHAVTQHCTSVVSLLRPVSAHLFLLLFVTLMVLGPWNPLSLERDHGFSLDSPTKPDELKWGDFHFSWGCSSTLIVLLREFKRNFGSPLSGAHREESGNQLSLRADSPAQALFFLSLPRAGIAGVCYTLGLGTCL